MMELNLNRVDYMQCGTTLPKCMKVLPKAPKENTNKVVVADSHGIVQIFGMKKKDVQNVFKTLPGTAVSRVELGGPIGKPRDRVFVAAGTTVRGYSRKGSSFMDFKSESTETIRSMFIEGAVLMACGNYIYHQYNDLKDEGYYLCSDQICDVIALPTDNRSLTPILACSNRMLRVLQDSAVLFEIDVPGPPQALCLNGNDGGPGGDEVLYGTYDGQIGLLQFSSLTAEHRWQLNNEKRSGGILSLGSFDITGNGVADMLVSRDDGLIEVYEFDDSDEPQLKFSHMSNESITAVQGGYVGSPTHAEVVCSSYSGWVMGFTTEPQHSALSASMRLPQTAKGAAAAAKQQAGSMTVGAGDEATLAKIALLRKEIEELGIRLQTERERFQQIADTNPTAVSTVPLFNINDKFIMDRDDASYTLSIEVQTPMDNVLVQSGTPVDVLDVDKNSAVVSFSACDSEDGNFLLATYRCQANTTRLELKLRTIEGQYGTIQVYVTLKVKPMTCRVRQFVIKPLSMHVRTNHFDENRPYNRLRLTGNFSLAEMHSWIHFCLPELPDRTPPGDVVTFHFVSVFLGTFLECSYRRNEAIFRSDNISAISILKDALTKEATKKSIRLDVACEVNDKSVPHVLTLLHPKIEHQFQLTKKVTMIEALKDLEVQENGMDCMTPANKEILRDAEKLLAEFRRQPCHLERIYGVVTDLYIDMYKFRGQNVRNNVPKLVELLENYTYESLIDFFANSASGVA